MNNLEKAIERLKVLQCPSGQLEERVEEILQVHGIAKNDISVKRNEKYYNTAVQAYSVKISNDDTHKQNIVILAKPGLDDYVTTVVNAYMR